MKKATLVIVLLLASVLADAGIVEFIAEPEDYPIHSSSGGVFTIFLGHAFFGTGLSLWGFEKNKVRGWFFALYATVGILSGFYSENVTAYFFFGWVAMYFCNQLLMPALDALDRLINQTK